MYFYTCLRAQKSKKCVCFYQKLNMGKNVIYYILQKSNIIEMNKVTATIAKKEYGLSTSDLDKIYCDVRITSNNRTAYLYERADINKYIAQKEADESSEMKRKRRHKSMNREEREHATKKFKQTAEDTIKSNMFTCRTIDTGNMIIQDTIVNDELLNIICIQIITHNKSLSTTYGLTYAIAELMAFGSTCKMYYKYIHEYLRSYSITMTKQLCLHKNTIVHFDVFFLKTTKEDEMMFIEYGKYEAFLLKPTEYNLESLKHIARLADVETSGSKQELVMRILNSFRLNKTINMPLRLAIELQKERDQISQELKELMYPISKYSTSRKYGELQLILRHYKITDVQEFMNAVHVKQDTNAIHKLKQICDTEEAVYTKKIDDDAMKEHMCSCGRIKSMKCASKVCGNCCNDASCSFHSTKKQNRYYRNLY